MLIMAKKCSKLRGLAFVALIIALVGALNWGLSALGLNVIEALLGTGIITKILYGIVGISGIYAGYKILIK